MPNSSQFVFPMMATPEAFSRGTTGRCVEGRLEVFSDEAMKGLVSIRASGREVSAHLLRSMAEEHVVSTFLAHMLSLIATVITFNSPREGSRVVRDYVYERVYTGIFLFDSMSPRNQCLVAKKQDLLVYCRRHGRMT